MNRFIKISTDNGEDRWINLDLVHRISMARDLPNGQPVMVFTFDGGERVTLHGNDDVQRMLIRRIAKRLDEISLPAEQYAA